MGKKIQDLYINAVKSFKNEVREQLEQALQFYDGKIIHFTDSDVIYFSNKDVQIKFMDLFWYVWVEVSMIDANSCYRCNLRAELDYNCLQNLNHKVHMFTELGYNTFEELLEGMIYEIINPNFEYLSREMGINRVKEVRGFEEMGFLD